MKFYGRRLTKGTLLYAAIFFAVVSLAMSSGCVATSTSPPPRGVVVNGPPPQPIAEQRPSPPTSDAAWVGGYWHWSGARYVWIPGHWESAPPGAQWYGPQYTRANDGRFYYEPGGWSHQNAPTANALH